MTAASMCTAHCAATPDKNIAKYITLSNRTDLKLKFFRIRRLVFFVAHLDQREFER